jgi:hypothetical protein
MLNSITRRITTLGHGGRKGADEVEGRAEEEEGEERMGIDIVKESHAVFFNPEGERT